MGEGWADNQEKPPTKGNLQLLATMQKLLKAPSACKLHNFIGYVHNYIKPDLTLLRANILLANNTMKLFGNDRDSANIAHRVQVMSNINFMSIRKKVSNSVDLTISILIHIQ